MPVDGHFVYVAIIAFHQEGITVEMCSQEHTATNVLPGKSLTPDA